MHGRRHRYAVITPARDEERWLPGLIASMERQTLRPARWVIVDDGSSDSTADIAGRAAVTHEWITLVRLPLRKERYPGPGVVYGFSAGIKQVSLDEIRFIVKLDADLSLPDDYFERLLREFERRPHLGIAGGVAIENGEIRNAGPKYHVRGATKMYRIECFREIGGLRPMQDWDGIDEVMAISRGWETESIPDLAFIHHRPAGSHGAAGGLIGTRFRQGRGSYIRVSHPLVPWFRAVRDLFRPPIVVGSLAYLWGYISGFLRGADRLDDPDAVWVQRALQKRRARGLADSCDLASQFRKRRCGEAQRSS